MTLDDQLSALAPLDSSGGGVIARLAGYATGPTQLRKYRERGSIIPDDRLEAIAQRLEILAGIARSLKRAAEN